MVSINTITFRNSYFFINGVQIILLTLKKLFSNEQRYKTFKVQLLFTIHFKLQSAVTDSKQMTQYSMKQIFNDAH